MNKTRLTCPKFCTLFNIPVRVNTNLDQPIISHSTLLVGLHIVGNDKLFLIVRILESPPPPPPLPTPPPPPLFDMIVSRLDLVDDLNKYEN